MAKYAGIKAENIINPSSGLLYRNPTHYNEAEYAEDQTDIVNAVSQALGKERIKEVFTYKEENPGFLPGFKKIKSMDRDQLAMLFKSLMRSRPNIFGIKIVLGDYMTAKPIESREIRKLNSNKQKFHTQIAEEIADVFGDKNQRIVAFSYSVLNSDPSAFKSVANAFGYVEDEEYNDEKLFEPAIEIIYFPNI